MCTRPAAKRAKRSSSCPSYMRRAAGHRYALPHHRGEGLHHAVRVELEELVADLGVDRLVALLVSGDQAADLGEGGVAVVLGVPGGVAVGDEGGSFLKGGVDDAVNVVGIIVRTVVL
ncbi:uncharacterized protein A4U43_C04F34730 [Asparagus officinalis]|uniref:Uncharacterized protein n=1 Tax=Asparagus officinalis TaxID=4686 RepID=A0A5P1F5S1_ASPOF|nr:uncharacterized protein A4U43_C04F34730 [Asparagus officinalis]